MGEGVYRTSMVHLKESSPNWLRPACCNCSQLPAHTPPHQISIQLINCIFYLVPNAYVMTHDCAWFSKVVIWSGFVRCGLGQNFGTCTACAALSVLMLCKKRGCSSPARRPCLLPTLRRWSCWNSLFLIFWVQASSVNPARSQRYREIPGVRRLAPKREARPARVCHMGLASGLTSA